MPDILFQDISHYIPGLYLYIFSYLSHILISFHKCICPEIYYIQFKGISSDMLRYLKRIHHLLTAHYTSILESYNLCLVHNNYYYRYLMKVSNMNMKDFEYHHYTSTFNCFSNRLVHHANYNIIDQQKPHLKVTLEGRVLLLETSS